MAPRRRSEPCGIAGEFEDVVVTTGFFRGAKVPAALRAENEKTEKKISSELGFFFRSFHLFVTTTGFEPVRLAAPPPQDGESTNFSMWPVDAGFPAL